MKKEASHQKIRVAVAMSGGIDSSVAAALLKKGRFLPDGRQVDVIGIFMKFWAETDADKTGGSWNRCCSPDAEKRARTVAKIIGIPFYAVNLEKEFKKRIVDSALKIYKKGQTPNPCAVCNKEIKFGLFIKKALSFGADFIATGHYARSRADKNGIHLLRAKDKDKDQSYFLWRLRQNQLKYVLFPIGDYKRAEVERLAKAFKLPFAGVAKSQEICFVRTTINDFLTKYLGKKPGNIVNGNGKIIGHHEGLYFYTLGQRRGIGLSGGPFYVLKKDLRKNMLIATSDEKKLYKKELTAENINWILGGKVKSPRAVSVKIRYRHNDVPVTIKVIDKTTVNIHFKTAQKAITPGQSVVFYKGRELLGGGIISK